MKRAQPRDTQRGVANDASKTNRGEKLGWKTVPTKAALSVVFAVVKDLVLRELLPLLSYVRQIENGRMRELHEKREIQKERTARDESNGIMRELQEAGEMEERQKN